MSSTSLPSDFALEPHPDGLQLRWLSQPKMTPLRIDFLSGKNAFRAAHASIKDEAIARACGLGKPNHNSLLDATAGLARDAFILARLGAQVALNERHTVVRALLADALQRLYEQHPDWQTRLYLLPIASLAEVVTASFDVVYLDPMYPSSDRKVKAAVKKDMQMFHQLVGPDADADNLLAPARRIARQRVVVKRPQHAGFLGGVVPHTQVVSKKHRFDIYFPE